MIGYIEGVVVRTGDDSLVVKVDGTGLGLEVAVPARVRKAPGQAVQLHTHTHIGSDAAIIAGFGSAEELEMYRHLLDVSGVGPRMAVRVLSSHPVNRIVQALDDEDPAPFQAVSGIGRKLANRVILELRGKLVPEPGMRLGPTGGEEALQALVGLGYTRVEAQLALEQIAATNLRVEERIAAALRILGTRATP